MFSQTAPTTLLTQLTRLARRRPQERPLLEAVVGERLEELGEAAVAVAVETGDPVGQVLAKAIEKRGARALVERLSELCRGDRFSGSVALQEVAVVSTSKVYDQRMAQWPDPDAAQKSELAKLAHHLGLSLRQVGKRREATEMTQRAVDLWRSLARDSPDDFSAWLAEGLISLSMILNTRSRWAEALLASREAVEILRSLVERHGEALLPLLGQSLYNLSGDLSDLERREEALDAAGEAVSIFRRLAAGEPDRFAPALANALLNHGSDLAGAGQFEQAYEAILEATEIRQKLALERPDRHEADLARDFYSLGNRLDQLGRFEEACAATQRAVDIRRKLSRDRAGSFDSDLAHGLNTLSHRLSDLGQSPAALAASEEATAIYRRLAANEPRAFARPLAESLDNLCNRLGELGRSDPALEAGREAVSLRRSLIKEDPDTFRPQLAAALHNLSSRLGEIDEYEEACAAASEAVAILGELAALRPAVYRHQHAIALANQGRLSRYLGRNDQALACHRQGAAIRRELADQRPEAFLHHFASALVDLASSEAAGGGFDGAFAAVEEAIAVFERLRLTTSHLPARERQRWLAFGDLSRVLLQLKKPERALELLEEALEGWQGLAASDFQNAKSEIAAYHRDLARTFDELGRLQDALDHSGQGIGLLEELAGVFPKRFDATLGEAKLNHGIFAWRLGRRPEAIEAVAAAESLFLKLVEQRPILRGKLARCWSFLAVLLLEDDRPLESGSLARRAVEEQRELLREENNEIRSAELAASLTPFAMAEDAAGHLESSLGAIEESLAIYERLERQHGGIFQSELANAKRNRSELFRKLAARKEASIPPPQSEKRKHHEALTHLNRLAQRRKAGTRLIASALDGRLADSAEAAVDVAIETGDPMGPILAGMIGKQASPELAKELADYCEARGIDSAPPLQELMLEAIRLSLDRDHEKWVSLGERERVEVVRKLNNLGQRQRAAGQVAAALETLDAALESALQLGTSRPGPFLIALTHHNLGMTYQEAGRHQEAVAATRRAVDLRRDISSSQSVSSIAELAGSLINLGNQLGSIGNYDGALESVAESVDLLRDLYAKEPIRFETEFAVGLNNLSRRLEDLGRSQEAIASAREAIAFFRLLAGEKPDQVRHFLAVGLHNLSNQLQAVGSWEEASDASREAVGHFRLLAASRPESFLGQFASALNGQAIVFATLQHVPEALADIDQALEIFEALSAESPGAYIRDLAITRINRGAVLHRLNRHEEALEETRQAVSSLRSASGEGESYLAALALALECHGGHLRELGRNDSAVSTLAEAVDLYRQLDSRRAGPYRLRLAKTLVKLARCLGACDRLDEALESVHEAEIHRRAAAVEIGISPDPNAGSEGDD